MIKKRVSLDGAKAPQAAREVLKMKKYFCVCSSYYDDGRTVANIVDVKETSEKPAPTFYAGRRCDSYFDWFDSEQAAKDFIKDCAKA